MSEKKELEANTRGGWECYHCGQMKPKVVMLKHLGGSTHKYLCEACLWQAVVDGTLVVQYYNKPATLTAESPTVILAPKPVVSDDGTIADDDMEFNFTGW